MGNYMDRQYFKNIFYKEEKIQPIIDEMREDVVDNPDPMQIQQVQPEVQMDYTIEDRAHHKIDYKSEQKIVLKNTILPVQQQNNVNQPNNQNNY